MKSRKSPRGGRGARAPSCLRIRPFPRNSAPWLLSLFRCTTLLSRDDREYFSYFVRRLWPARFFGTHSATFATSGMGHSIPANPPSHPVVRGDFSTSAGGISVFASGVSFRGSSESFCRGWHLVVW